VNPVATITGLGVLAPTGAGHETYWTATVEGRCAIGPATSFPADRYPASLAGEVAGFEAREHLPAALLPQTDPMTRMAMVAADWALADAGVHPGDHAEYQMGVVTGSSFGGFEFGQRELQNLWSQGSRHVSVYQSYAWFYAVNTGQISIRHGMRGPGRVLVAEQAGGLDAIGQARRQIRQGLSLVVTGGADRSLCPWGWVAHIASGRLCADRDPRTAYLPFDARAHGYVPGEGAAFLVLEDARAAERAGRHRYGDVVGYASTFDPPAGSRRPSALRSAIEGALADAGVGPAGVDVVYADAGGIGDLDRTEAAALTAVFGAHRIPVTAPKAGTGRLSSAAGPLDVATAVLSIRHQLIPPTPNVAAPAAGLGIDLVTGGARPARIHTALVVARGQGGFNAAVLVRAPESTGPG
jgi:act minimal PKS chain-length factor (CLF/KS beta)